MIGIGKLQYDNQLEFLRPLQCLESEGNDLKAFALGTLSVSCMVVMSRSSYTLTAKGIIN